MPADEAGHGPPTRPPPGTPGTGDPTEVTTTDRDERSVTSSLQSAHIDAKYLSAVAAWNIRLPGLQIIRLWRVLHAEIDVGDHLRCDRFRANRSGGMSITGRAGTIG